MKVACTFLADERVAEGMRGYTSGRKNNKKNESRRSRFPAGSVKRETQKKGRAVVCSGKKKKKGKKDRVD